MTKRENEVLGVTVLPIRGRIGRKRAMQYLLEDFNGYTSLYDSIMGPNTPPQVRSSASMLQCEASFLASACARVVAGQTRLTVELDRGWLKDDIVSGLTHILASQLTGAHEMSFEPVIPEMVKYLFELMQMEPWGRALSPENSALIAELPASELRKLINPAGEHGVTV